MNQRKAALMEHPEKRWEKQTGVLGSKQEAGWSANKQGTGRQQTNKQETGRQQTNKQETGSGQLEKLWVRKKPEAEQQARSQQTRLGRISWKSWRKNEGTRGEI